MSTPRVERQLVLNPGKAVTPSQRLALQRVELSIKGLPCPGAAGPLAVRLERTQGIVEAVVNPVTDQAVVAFDPGVVGLEGVVQALEREGLEVGYSVARWQLGMPGLKCPSCVSLLEDRVRRVRGVRQVSVNLDRETLTVEYSPRRTDVRLVTDAISAVGVDILPATVGVDLAGGEDDRTELGGLLRRMTFAAALALPAAALSHPDWFGLQGTVTLQGLGDGPFRIAAALISLVGILYSAAPLYRGAWSALRSRSANANTLVVLAISFAWLQSAVPLLGSQVGFPSSAGRVFFEVPLLVVTLLLLGQVLQERLETRRRGVPGVRRGTAPATLRVTRGSRVTTIPREQIVPGDIVWVNPKELVPVDGVVTDGNAMIDESHLTHEWPSKLKGPGDPVYALSVNETSPLGLRAVAVGKDTVFARVAALISAAQDSVTAAQRRMDRVAAHLTPAAAMAAVATFLAWYNLGPQPALAYATTALVGVLLMVSPRVLGVAASAPPAAALRQASARGLLVRSATVLEALPEVDTVVISDMEVAAAARGDAAVKALRQMGLDVMLMIDSDPETVRTMAVRLGVERAMGGLSREEQAEQVRRLRSAGRKIAVIDHGSSRAGALCEASVAIATGEIEEIVGAVAHVLLLRRDLVAVVDLLRLGRAMRRTMRQNILAACAYNVIALPLAGAVLAFEVGMPLAAIIAAAAAELVSLTLVARAGLVRAGSLER